MRRGGSASFRGVPDNIGKTASPDNKLRSDSLQNQRGARQGSVPGGSRSQGEVTHHASGDILSGFDRSYFRAKHEP